MIIFSNIGLARFFEYGGNGKDIAICCKTPDQAYDLNYAFRIFGRKWANGQKYDEHCTYYTKEYCCYTNNGQISRIQTCKNKNYIIINAEDFNDYFDHKFQVGDFAIDDEGKLRIKIGEHNETQGFSTFNVLSDLKIYPKSSNGLRMPAISDLLARIESLPTLFARHNTIIVIKIKTFAEEKRLVNILKKKFKMIRLCILDDLYDLDNSELSKPSKHEFIRIQLLKQPNRPNSNRWAFGYGSSRMHFDKIDSIYAIKISDISKIYLPTDEAGLDTPEDNAKDCYNPIKDNDFNNTSLHMGLSDFGKFVKYNENDVKIMMQMMQSNKNEGEDNMVKVKDIYVNKEKGTIVLKWENGDTTKVTCGPEDTFDLEKGVAMAIAKYSLGNSYEAGAVFQRYVRKAEISLSKQNKNKK